MAAWYARKGICNIDSVSGGTTSDVWNSLADGLGAWMDISVLTAGGDTTLEMNGYNDITINITINLGIGNLRNTTAGSGDFLVTANVGVTANLLPGVANLLTRSGNQPFALTGNITGSATGGAVGISNTSTGACTINGNIVGGTSWNTYAWSSTAASGDVTVNGNTTAGTGAAAVYNWTGGTGLMTLTGNVIHGLAYPAHHGYAIRWVPASVSNYVQYPAAGAATLKLGKTIPAADVKLGVNGDGVNPPATGTYAGGGGPLVGSGGLVG